MLDTNLIGPGFVLIEYTGYILTEPDGDADWSPESGTLWGNGITASRGSVSVDATLDNEGGAVEVWVEFAPPAEIAPQSCAVVTFPEKTFYLTGFTLDPLRELEVLLPAPEVAMTIRRERIKTEDQVLIDGIEVTERHVVTIYRRYAAGVDPDPQAVERVIAGVTSRGRSDWVMLAEVRDECVDAGFADPHASAIAIALGMHADGSATLGQYDPADGFTAWTEQGASACFKLARALNELGVNRPSIMSIMLDLKTP